MREKLLYGAPQERPNFLLSGRYSLRNAAEPGCHGTLQIPVGESGGAHEKRRALKHSASSSDSGSAAFTPVQGEQPRRGKTEYQHLGCSDRPI